MRLATCLVAALLSTTSLATPVATACGSYSDYQPTPTVMPVSSHFIYNGSSAMAARQRAFAVTNASLTLDPQQTWERIESHSYDSTSMIDLARLRRPVTVTVVGPSGARVVRTTARVALNHAFFSAGVMEAVEVPATTSDRFTIALAGSHPDAIWHELAGSYTFTQKIQDTEIEVTQLQTNGAPQKQIVSSGVDLGTFEGYVIGAVEINGTTFVVMQRRDHSLYTVRA